MSGDSGEKTEDATPKKLQDAKKKGQVAKSQDLPAAVIMLTAALYFWVMGDWLIGKLIEMFTLITQLYTMDFKVALGASIKIMLQVGVATIMLPFVALLAIMAILGNIVQFGVLFSLDPVKPNMEKVNPAAGAKRIFAVKQLVNTGLSLVKTIVTGIALFFVIRWGMAELQHDLSQCNVECQFNIYKDLLSKLMMIILPIVIVIAIVDYLVQKAQFTKEQKMTKEEVKREMKEMFGDPHVRGARQGIRREIAENDIQSKIKTAKILLIDIGQAIALHYEQGVTPLPIIAAIGKEAMARKMVEIAQMEKVPIVSDARLVSDLIEHGKLDLYIPEITIDRVAQAMRNANKR